MRSTVAYRHIQASPSVTLENGIFMMHTPPARSNSPTGSKLRYSKALQLHKPQPRMNFTEKRVGILLFVLAVAALCCFGSAYYLFATRWETSIARQANPSNSLQVVEFDYGSRPIPTDPSERFMSYLPHSGFHNQRIALENAILMARILNRTLLVPPARLGKGAISYFPFDKLFELISSSDKDGLMHCNSPEAWESLPVECRDFFDYTLVPWNWIVDLSSIEAGQKLVYRWNAGDAWLRDVLRIGANDTFTFKDNSPLQYRYVDSDPVDFPHSRYDEAVATSLLDQVPHRLLQFGSLFGSSRIRLRRGRNIESRGRIRQAMGFKNPILIDLADKIKASMGGSFIGTHLRLEDGKFIPKGEETSREVWWKLVHDMLGFSEDDAASLESRFRNASIRKPPNIPDDIAAGRSPYIHHHSLSSWNRSQLPCRQSKHSEASVVLLNIPLYISTDVPKPETHPLLRVFFDTFPCTFLLSDFDRDLASLNSMKSGYDGLHLKPFLLPLLDAVVASRAHDMVGTRGSTFSQFTQDVLWRQYHGLEIVQRGS